MKELRILLIAFTLVNCKSMFAQTYSSIISDKEILDFYNSQINTEKKYDEEPKSKSKQVFIKIFKWDTSRIYLFNKRNEWLDTIFSQEDKKFIFLQINSIKDSLWRDKLGNSTIIKNKNQAHPNRYYLSIPLFSINRNYVVIRQIYYCGSLCAYGGARIYRKNNDGLWEYVGSVNSWMS